jgi:ribonucleotide monophosphatase NagD (HAD superfamily)
MCRIDTDIAFGGGKVDTLLVLTGVSTQVTPKSWKSAASTCKKHVLLRKDVSLSTIH